MRYRITQFSTSERCLLLSLHGWIRGFHSVVLGVPCELVTAQTHTLTVPQAGSTTVLILGVGRTLGPGILWIGLPLGFPHGKRKLFKAGTGQLCASQRGRKGVVDSLP